MTEGARPARPGLVPDVGRRADGEGSLLLGDGFTIACPPEVAGVARVFRRAVEAATGWGIEIVPGSGGDSGGVTLLLDETPSRRDAALPSSEEEAYTLRITDSGVSVTGVSPAGVFYGLQTLRQLMGPGMWRHAPLKTPSPPVVLGLTEIVDAPRYAWRGVHFDVSRHFFPKSFVLRLIDLASMHKCNVLHLHLTDDQGWRMQIDKYPRLTEVGAWRRESQVGKYSEARFDGKPHGGYYTKDDLREIVAYAAERFVSVLPEIDMPGHMVAAISAYPELGNTPEPYEVRTGWGISEHVLSLEPASIEFCKDVLDEVADVFPWRYVHAGGDECPVTEWASNPAAQALMTQQGYSDPRQLQGWFTARIAEHLASLGRVLVGWDEILEGGAPAGSVVMSWQGEQGGITAAAAGHDVVMAPMQWLYFDWSYTDDPIEPIAIFPATSVERVYSYDPVPEAIPSDRRHHVVGAQCQLWTEFVADSAHAEYMYMPRLCAFAEVVWSGGAASDRPSFSEFETRLRSHLPRLDALGVNYRPLEGPNPGQAREWSE